MNTINKIVNSLEAKDHLPLRMYNKKSSVWWFLKRCAIQMTLEWKAYRIKTGNEQFVEKDLPEVEDSDEYPQRKITTPFIFGYKSNNEAFKPFDWLSTK